MDEREAANRSAADYLARLRQRLADGKSEIQRLRESIDATHEHLAGMSRWIEQTDLQLRDERDRRTPGGGDEE
jgi:septal ring factor EnvC (AmiA/AmiB activator)